MTEPVPCPGCGQLDPMGDEDAWHSEGCPVVAATTSAQSRSPQRAVLLFVTGATAVDDLRALITLPDARPLHPSSEGFGRGQQEPWSDDECRDYAWTLIGRLAGKVEWSVAAIVPEGDSDV